MASEINLDGRSILVTGGTGSFGQAFVANVLERHKPHRLIIFSRDETKQWEMAAKFRPEEHRCLRYFIGDVRDVDRLEMAMKGVDYVVHAAALKFVPTAEYNPFECIRTNVQGTENVIRAAIRCNVKKVLGVSTDKAVSPANLYGATKHCAEKLLIAANNLSGEHGARFSVVRYGNVVGSRGSVVPLFARLLSEGAKELPITDERMTRFWIRLDDGVKLVLTSLEMMSGGEIFVPKLKATRVVDVAAVMAPHAPINTIGIRPGEKIHEYLLSIEEARMTVDAGDRYVVQPSLQFWHAGLAPAGGEAVSEDFVYSSETAELMGLDELRELIASVIPSETLAASLRAASESPAEGGAASGRAATG
ncbi:MAG: UDP-N-acetylglucosamine 4,6-dehydratase (inverting) [Maricaulaceae bacterium]